MWKGGKEKRVDGQKVFWNSTEKEREITGKCVLHFALIADGMGMGWDDIFIDLMTKSWMPKRVLAQREACCGFYLRSWTKRKPAAEFPQVYASNIERYCGCKELLRSLASDEFQIITSKECQCTCGSLCKSATQASEPRVVV